MTLLFAIAGAVVATVVDLILKDSVKNDGITFVMSAGAGIAAFLLLKLWKISNE